MKHGKTSYVSTHCPDRSVSPLEVRATFKIDFRLLCTYGYFLKDKDTVIYISMDSVDFISNFCQVIPSTLLYLMVVSESMKS